MLTCEKGYTDDRQHFILHHNVCPFHQRYISLHCQVLMEKLFAARKGKKSTHNWTSVDGTPSQIPAFDLTKASAKFEVAMSNGLGGDAFTRKYIISFLTLTLCQGQTRYLAHYPLHHMTYAPAKFEAAMSNGLGGNAFTRNI